MPKTALACNNPWRSGGQGNFLNRASYGLANLGDVTVYCAGQAPNTDDQFNHQSYTIELKGVGFSWHSQQLLKTPVLRRHRDLATLWADEYFDQQVKQDLQRRNQQSPDDWLQWFVGVAGQSATTMAWLKQNHSQDVMVWLYCLNAYLPFMQVQIVQELAVLQDPSKAAMHPKMLTRFTQECNLADYIVVNAAFAKQTFTDNGINPDKVGGIHPIVDAERFCPSPRIQDNKFRVLYVGTIDPRKGVHYLIPAFVQAAIPDS